MTTTEQDKQVLDRYRDLTVGEILRRARIKAGYEIEPIAGHLNMRASLLEALERDDYSRLPARVYVIGFVRTYAEALGLDGDKIAYLLKAQSVDTYDEPLINLPKPLNERRFPDPLIIIVSMGVFLLLLLLLWIFTGNGHEQPEIPEPPSEAVLQDAL